MKQRDFTLQRRTKMIIFIFSSFFFFFCDLCYVFACTCIFYFPCYLNMHFSPPCLSGCGDPRRTRYHSVGDLPLAACGISMHHLLHLQILPEQKEKTQPADNLKLCLSESPSVQHMYMRKHNGCVLVPYLPNNAFFFFFFLPVLGISAYS